MEKRDKQRELFLKLVNKQLEQHGVTYNDVKNQPDWYMQYKTTRALEKDFMDWGVNLLIEEFNMTQNLAEREMSWFILQWGLTTAGEYDDNEINEVVEVEVNRKNKTK